MTPQAPSLPHQITGLLEKGTSFEGRLTFQGTVRIGGEFKGEVVTEGTLVIQEGAQVQAQVQASTVVISGSFQGNIVARKEILMHPPAVFKGQVKTPVLSIKEGVVFEGSSAMEDL